MANWHEKTCSFPDIVLLPNLPMCQSCGTLPETKFDGHPTTNNQLLSPALANEHKSALRWPAKDLQKPTSFHISQDIEDSPNEVSVILLEHDDRLSDFPRPKPGSKHVFDYTQNSVCSRAPSPDSAIDVGSIRSSDEGNGSWQSGHPQSLKLSHDQRTLYSSLASPDHIRVLKLKRGSFQDPIHFDLEVTSLWSCSGFEALSYTWADAAGDSQRCRTIYTGRWWDGFLVTKNCEAALRTIRSTAEDRRVWVDAICINQNDVAERSQQVSLMRDIYATAWRVIVYLGDSSSDSDVGLPLITEASNLQSFRESLDEEKKEVSLSNLFKRPYFSRVWVIQEITLARSITIICGKSSATSSRADRQLRRVAESGYGPDWLKYAQANHGVPLEDLLSLLARTRACECADPRDKVFGLFGLIRHASINGLVPDYRLSLAQVYSGIASYIVQHQGRVDILEHAGVFNNDQREDDWPSWVPDWRNPTSQYDVRISSRQFHLMQKNNSAINGSWWYSDTPFEKSKGLISQGTGHVKRFADQHRGILTLQGTMFHSLSDCERQVIRGQEVIVHRSDQSPASAAYIFAPCNTLPRNTVLFAFDGWDRPALLEPIDGLRKFRFLGGCAVVFEVKHKSVSKTGQRSDRLPFTSLEISPEGFRQLQVMSVILSSSIWFPPCMFGACTGLVNEALWGDEMTYWVIELSQQENRIREEFQLWSSWKIARDRIAWICRSPEGLQCLVAEIKELVGQSPYENWKLAETASLRGDFPLNKWNIDRFVWSFLPRQTRGGHRMSYSDSRSAITDAYETGHSLLQLVLEWGRDTASLLYHLDDRSPGLEGWRTYLPGSDIPSRWQMCWAQTWEFVRGCADKISDEASKHPLPGWRARTLLEMTARDLCRTDSVVLDPSTIRPGISGDPSDTESGLSGWDWDDFQATMERRQTLLADALELSTELYRYAHDKSFGDIRKKMLARGLIRSLQWNFDAKMIVELV